MKNKSKKISIVVVLLILFCIIFAVELCSSLMPQPLEESPLYSAPVDGTVFESDYHKIGKKSYAIYAFVGDKSSDNGNDEFIITIVERRGLLDNQYVISVDMPQDDEILSDPPYVTIADYPQLEVKHGKKYYGSVYVGIAPPDCKSLSIGDNKMTLKKMSLTLNEKKYNFMMYYGFSNENHSSSKISIEHTDKQ